MRKNGGMDANSSGKKMRVTLMIHRFHDSGSVALRNLCNRRILLPLVPSGGFHEG